MRQLIFVSTGFVAMLAIGMALGYLAFVKPPPAPPVVREGEGKKELQPSFVLDSHQELKFKDGIGMDVWDIRAYGVKEITARLLIIAEGKSSIAQQVIHKWDDWPKEHAEVAWQLYYLLQDDQAVGAKRKRVPTFTIRFGSAKPSRMTGLTSTLSVDGEFSTPSTSADSNAAINASEERVVYLRIHNAPKWSGTLEYSPTVESLTKAATGGRVIVALTLEWK